MSLFAGAVLVARSPSSAIAIVSELRAKGPFTKTVLGVTVVSDGVVIILFALASSVSDTLLTHIGLNLVFLLLVLGELALSAGIGHLLSKTLLFVLSRKISGSAKSVLILAAGYGTSSFCGILRGLSRGMLPFDVFIEPLLVCMIGSFLVTNQSSHRPEFLRLLEGAGPAIYAIFFTLTGASLPLDMLGQILTVVLVLFCLRLLGIFIGAFGGGLIAGDPTRYNWTSWMALITQAGIGIGLAKEVAIKFPEWGHTFATVIISIIVLNQISGAATLQVCHKKSR